MTDYHLTLDTHTISREHYTLEDDPARLEEGETCRIKVSSELANLLRLQSFIFNNPYKGYEVIGLPAYDPLQNLWVCLGDRVMHPVHVIGKLEIA